MIFFVNTGLWCTDSLCSVVVTPTDQGKPGEKNGKKALPQVTVDDW